MPKAKISLKTNEDENYYVVYMNDKRWCSVLKVSTTIDDLKSYFDIKDEDVE